MKKFFFVIGIFVFFICILGNNSQETPPKFQKYFTNKNVDNFIIDLKNNLNKELNKYSDLFPKFSMNNTKFIIHDNSERLNITIFNDSLKQKFNANNYNDNNTIIDSLLFNQITKAKKISQNEIYSVLTGIDDLCQTDDDEKRHSCIMLILTVFEFLRTYTNLDLVSDYVLGNETCKTQLYTLSNNSYIDLYNIFEKTGKSLQDFGMEESCIEKGYNFYLVRLSLNSSVSKGYFQDEVLRTINKFLGIYKFSVGICFFKSCSDFIEQFFNKTANAVFFERLKVYGVKKLELVAPSRNLNYSDTFLVFVYVLFIYLLFKLLCTFFGFFIKDKNYYDSRRESEFSKNSLNSQFSKEHDSDYNFNNDRIYYNNYDVKNRRNKRKKNKKIFEYNSFFSEEDEGVNKNNFKKNNNFACNFNAIAKYNYNNNDNRESPENLIEHNYNKNSEDLRYEVMLIKKIKNISCLKRTKKFIYFLYDFFSFNKNFWHLSEIRNEYYTDENIEYLNYLKLINLFFLTYNHVFYTSIILPHRDYFNVKYFTSIFFGLFKFTNFAGDCYIVLEGLITIYKLMNFLKKQNDTSFKTFLIFYMTCIPKVFLFLVIYFFFIIQFKNIGIFCNTNSLFNNILIDKYREKECFSEDQFLIFNPFYFLINIKDPSNYKKCFRSIFFYVNFYLSYTLFLLIIYISFKLKKQAFDILITLIILTLNITYFIYFIDNPYFDDKRDGKMLFEFILGENFGFKNFHLFIIKYFVGVLGGLFFFYSHETVLNDSILNSKDSYLPFSYVYGYLVFINIKHSNVKDILKFSKISNNNITPDKIDNIISDDRNRYNTIEENKEFTSAGEDFKKYSPIGTQTEKSINMSDSNNSSQKKSKNSSKILNQIKLFFSDLFYSSRKILLIFLSSFIMLFLCFYYIVKFLLIFSYKTEERFIILDLSLDLKLLYWYEKNIFAFAFLIFITSMSSSKRMTVLKVLPESKLFLLFGRINLAYFCSIDTIVYIFFTVYDIELYFSYQNIFFLTLGLSVIIFICSFILVYLFELPIRKVLKLFQVNK